MTVGAITVCDIERARGDTKALVFVIKHPTTLAAIDVSLWTNFLLTVDPSKIPTDALNNVFQAAGSFVSDGTDGKVKFYPPGDSAIGKYYYDAQGLDNEAKKCTFAKGKYKIIQDITKD